MVSSRGASWLRGMTPRPLCRGGYFAPSAAAAGLAGLSPPPLQRGAAPKAGPPPLSRSAPSGPRCLWRGDPPLRRYSASRSVFRAAPSRAPAARSCTSTATGSGISSAASRTRPAAAALRRETWTVHCPHALRIREPRQGRYLCVGEGMSCAVEVAAVTAPAAAKTAAVVVAAAALCLCCVCDCRRLARSRGPVHHLRPPPRRSSGRRASSARTAPSTTRTGAGGSASAEGEGNPEPGPAKRCSQFSSKAGGLSRL